MPIIAVTAFRDHKHCENPRVHLNTAYVNAVIRAGGTPLLIPVGIPVEQHRELLNRVDGLILTGGGDINPATYGRPMHATVSGIDDARDEIDISLARLAIEMKKPLLGICRGYQIINTVHGGTLFRDIASQKENALFHACWNDLPRDFEAHEVVLEPGSRLAEIIGKSPVSVNSLHHQGVETVGQGLKVVGTASDSLVEAFEVPNHPFAIGVQWHPEAMPDRADMQAIFRALVAAAQA